jgi:hypothetical protein
MDGEVGFDRGPLHRVSGSDTKGAGRPRKEHGVIVRRTRFWLFAGIAGAVVGEILAAGVAAALSWLVPATAQLGRVASLLYSGSLMVIGLALGVWSAVALLRGWYRSLDDAGGVAFPPYRARARAGSPRPIRYGRCLPLRGTSRRVECGNARRA